LVAIKANGYLCIFKKHFTFQDQNAIPAEMIRWILLAEIGFDQVRDILQMRYLVPLFCSSRYLSRKGQWKSVRVPVD